MTHDMKEMANHMRAMIAQMEAMAKEMDMLEEKPNEDMGMLEENKGEDMKDMGGMGGGMKGPKMPMGKEMQPKPAKKVGAKPKAIKGLQDLKDLYKSKYGK